MEALIRAAVAELQVIEDIIAELYGISVDTATDNELDVLGRIVGENRKGKGDDVYRIWVKARMMANRSSGTAEELMAIAYIVTNGTVPIVISEVYPAAVALQIGATPLVNPDDLQAILQDARGAAISLVVTSDMSPDAFAFAFDPNGAGFGDSSNSNTGGLLAGP